MKKRRDRTTVEKREKKTWGGRGEEERQRVSFKKKTKKKCRIYDNNQTIQLRKVEANQKKSVGEEIYARQKRDYKTSIVIKHQK